MAQRIFRRSCWSALVRLLVGTHVERPLRQSVIFILFAENLIVWISEELKIDAFEAVHTLFNIQSLEAIDAACAY